MTSALVSRIASLPRRDWRENPDELVRELTTAFRTPTGTQELRPIQAAIIYEALCENMPGFKMVPGAVGNARVGAGKTLAQALIASAWELEGLRNMLFVPPGFEEKTLREFADYRKHWRMPDQYDLTTYRDVSHDVDELVFKSEPDSFLLDEASTWRRVTDAGGAMRAAAYLLKRERQRKRVRVVALDGTMYKEGLIDYGHILAWGLGDGSPAPLKPGEIRAWHKGLRGDAGLWPTIRSQLGADPHADVKAAFRDRLFHTPGVIISTDQFTGVQLAFRLDSFDPGTADAVRQLRATGIRPDGLDTIAEKTDEDAQEDEGPGTTWAAERQLACGFYYTPDPKPPQWWAKPRKRWFGHARMLISCGHAKTELQARRFAERAGGASLELWTAWDAVRKLFEPRYVPVWLSAVALERAKRWGRATPGIVFVDHRAFAARLAAETGWAWFADGGKDANGRHIDAIYPLGVPADETVIASRFACGRGRNLQAWNRALFSGPPSNGRDAEQNYGRIYRDGQWRACEVTLFDACPAHKIDLQKVLLLSQDELETMGRTNAILTATWR